MGLCCCIPPLSSAWPSAIHIFFFFGPHLLPLLAGRAAAFLSCSRQGCWRFLLFLTPLSGCTWFLFVAGFGHTHILLFWAALLIGLSCCVPVLSSAWPLWPLLLPRAVFSGRASVRFCLSCCFPAVLSAWPVYGVAPCSLLARSAAFLLCPRRGLWPFFRVPYLGRRSVCYWRDVFLLSLLLLGRAFVRCRPILHVAFRRYMLPPLAAFARPCVLSSCSGGFSGYVPAAFCQALSPPCGRAAAFLATCQPPPARRYSGSSLRPGGGFLVTCHPPSARPFVLGSWDPPTAFRLSLPPSSSLSANWSALC